MSASLHIPYRAGRHTNRFSDEMAAAAAAVDRLPSDAKDRLYHLVGHPGQRLAVGGVGLLTIRVDFVTGTYQPAEVGQKALIFCARDIPANLGGRLIDLVAWQPRTGETFRRLGTTDLLGEWVLSTTEQEPPTVFENPATWAKADGQGIAILDWHAAYRHLGHVPALAVQDVAFGQRLRAALRPPAMPRPTIFIGNMGGQHVAVA